jgi:hypothetical protein
VTRDREAEWRAGYGRRETARQQLVAVPDGKPLAARHTGQVVIVPQRRRVVVRALSEGAAHQTVLR